MQNKRSTNQRARDEIVQKKNPFALYVGERANQSLLHLLSFFAHLRMVIPLRLLPRKSPPPHSLPPPLFGGGGGGDGPRPRNERRGGGGRSRRGRREKQAEIIIVATWLASTDNKTVEGKRGRIFISGEQSGFVFFSSLSSSFGDAETILLSSSRLPFSPFSFLRDSIVCKQRKEEEEGGNGRKSFLEKVCRGRNGKGSRLSRAYISF